MKCNVLFSVISFCIIFAKEIIFALSSLMVLVCNITFLRKYDSHHRMNVL